MPLFNPVSAVNDNVLFGRGTDGAITVVGSITLTRNIYATTYSVPLATSVAMAGFIIFATISITVAGTVSRDGIAAVNATGAAALAAAVLGASGAGGNGANGAGNAGGNVTRAIGAAGGIGGEGGLTAGANAGGPAGTATELGASEGGATGTNSDGFNIAGMVGAINSLVIASTLTRMSGGGGGGGGGGGSSNSGGGGGSGGGHGMLCAPSIVITGTCSAVGGNGGNAITGGGVIQTRGAGGGGGGGVFSLVYRRKTLSGTVAVTGGIKGVYRAGTDPGASLDTSANGSNGAALDFNLAA